MSAVIQLPVPRRATRSQIDAFLAHKRIAFVGVSRNPRDFSRMLFREFQKRGYEVIPVNPKLTNVDGIQCYSSLREAPNVPAVLLMTSPEVSSAVMDDCIAAGVKQVWMYGAAGKGAVDEGALERGREFGLDVIRGECPFMFFPKPGLPHNLHGFVRRILGTYPA